MEVLDDWAKEVKAFEETKAGVKGLVDSGVTKVPRIFVHPQAKLQKPSVSSVESSVEFRVPLIDLHGVEGVQRKAIVEQIRQACEQWGFFQMVSHGMDVDVINATLEATRRLHEQPREDKVRLFSDDSSQKVRLYTVNGSVHESRPGPWRDALACACLDDTLDSEEVPQICRKEMEDYVQSIIKLRETLSELLSEALGLSSDYLSRIECMKSEFLTWLYYPACPEPDLAFGAPQHSDPTFLTILLQDTIGGLQFLHQDHWVDLPPIPGALIAHIGDLMQIISNDKFKSADHRVLAQGDQTRVSAACFLYPSAKNLLKPYGPIMELMSDNNQPMYKEVAPLEYALFHQSRAMDGTSTLSHYKL
ncbi:1-aminocyclopropane-1-carboxylate oxidase-like [Heracleum sosnowskyi]|uniref:1-aminocyclopropane-1-carboxylate oxidase-like n=1 Tax=Heracleum sosnowskyi TaxID=360622 RepID=A0AAD8HTE1_9APIA|nr:1-aminocyclopropane-1-carboxylate oxidase-like [Heracleum sosnowskyi]